MTEPFVDRTDYGFVWGGGDGPDVEVTRTAEFPRESGKVCRILTVRAGAHELQVYVSPTGRSIRVHLDGAELVKGET